MDIFGTKYYYYSALLFHEIFLRNVYIFVFFISALDYVQSGFLGFQNTCFPKHFTRHGFWYRSQQEFLL